MHRPPPLVLALALLLLPLASRAGDPPSGLTEVPRQPARHLVVRLSELAAATAPAAEVRLAGGVSTIITTPWPLHARGTGVAGRGERPFEVLLGSHRVVLTPTRPLVAGERFPFVLRLADETVVPLVLAAAPAGRADGVVALGLDDDSAAELRVQLAAVTDHARGLEARLRQALQEQDSEDFALAGLLAGGNAPLTALVKVRERLLVSDERGQIKLVTFAPRAPARHGTSRIAVVMTAMNRSAAPLELSVADLYRRESLERVPRAVRATAGKIAPGAKGSVAIVLDGASLGSEGDGEPLELELQVRRGEVRSDLPVELAPDDFSHPTWWPF